MKQIISLMLLTMFAFSCNGQNTVHTSSAGHPKIVIKKVFTDYGERFGAFGGGIQDREGNMWFGTGLQGVYRYDGKSFTHFTDKEGLGSSTGTTIVEDKEGNILVGTQNGISRYDGKKFNMLSIPSTEVSDFLPGLGNYNNKTVQPKPMNCSKCESNGHIWLWSGFDFYSYNGNLLTVAIPGISGYLKQEARGVNTTYEMPNIWQVFEDKKGNIWFTTGSCCCFNKTWRLDGSRVNHPCVLNNCKHDLHNQQGLALHNAEIEKSLTNITTSGGHHSISFTAILEDKGGNMWFGTWDSGVYRYDGKFLSHFSDKDGLGSTLVGTIFEDKAGNIWFGTGAKNENIYDGNGVFRYDGKELAHFTRKDGLCSKGVFHNNTVSFITEDNTGKIWFAGDGGVCSNDGKVFTNFTTKDGLGNDPVNTVITDKAGNVWFCTEEMGLYRYDGKEVVSFTEKE